MAKCSNPTCNSTSFRAENVTPSSSNYVLLFVCCTRCSTTVGVLDYYNIGTVTKGIDEKINTLERNVTNTRSDMNSINHNLGTIIKQLNVLLQKKD